ncbi:MAG: radical SAM protein [Candidatus Sumerlaeota bacterium]|nr:radical SAM protein [Candidatus Sumerlaeota bacterium]
MGDEIDLNDILRKSSEGRRLEAGEGARLFDCCDLAALGEAAHRVRMRKARGNAVTYVVDRNINYTNVCTSKCLFCAFHRDPGDREGYVLSYDEIGAKVAETIALGGKQILLQGGLNPELRIGWYEGLLRFLKSLYGIYVHGFSAPEIIHIARLENLSVATVLGKLREAGLDSLPGGGAEILCEKIRSEVSPHKCSVDEWFDVHRAAHRMGMRTTATMMFGHIESIADRIEHFERVRALQDETGGFTAFIAWTFQPGATPLGKRTQRKTAHGHARTNTDKHGQQKPNLKPRTPSPEPRLEGAFDYLRTIAIARLFIDNIPNFQVSWVTQGEAIAQAGLMFGCNDFGSTMIEENVVRSAGCEFRLSEARIRGLIQEAGFAPLRRDYQYKNLD